MYDLPEHESGKVPSLQDPNRTTPLLPLCASANGREPAAARTMPNELYCVAHHTQQGQFPSALQSTRHSVCTIYDLR